MGLSVCMTPMSKEEQVDKAKRQWCCFSLLGACPGHSSKLKQLHQCNGVQRAARTAQLRMGHADLDMCSVTAAIGSTDVTVKLHGTCTDLLTGHGCYNFQSLLCCGLGSPSNLQLLLVILEICLDRTRTTTSVCGLEERTVPAAQKACTPP